MGRHCIKCDDFGNSPRGFICTRMGDKLIDATPIPEWCPLPKQCRVCRKKVESTYTAYLQDRSSEDGFCRECADKIMQEDLDKVVAECFERLCHVVNGGTAKDLAESMMRTFVREHRYLQNEFFIALWFFFQKYGKAELCDPRNEWAVKIAKIWGDSTL